MEKFIETLPLTGDGVKEMTEAQGDMAELYAKRNETIRAIIDECAAVEDLDEWGVKSEIAREVGVGDSRVHYVINEWGDLIQWRRNANRDPLEPEAVKEAYEDETLQAMAGQGEVVADGMGNVQVSVDFSLDEAFRAIKLLPGDLGMRVFTEVIEEADHIPKSGLEALFD